MRSSGKGSVWLLLIGFFLLLYIVSIVQEYPWTSLTMCVVILAGIGAAIYYKPTNGTHQKTTANAPTAKLLVTDDGQFDRRQFLLRNPDFRLPIRGSFDLKYTDAKGVETRRTIDAKTLDIYGNRLYLNTFCHLDKAPRMFRCDRMAILVDRETGEIIEGSAIGNWLMQKAREHPTISLPRR